MIFYGWKETHLKSSQPNHLICPSCKSQGSIIFSRFSTYFHVYWLPILPIGKRDSSICQNCYHSLEPKNMEFNIKNEYKSLKVRTIIPIWQFSGIILIACLILFFTYTDKKDKKTKFDYLNYPAVNDVYRYKTENKNFSTLLVYEILEDSVYVIPNEYEFSEMIGIEEIENDSNYGEYYYSYSLDDIKSMYNEGIIYDIKRK